MEDAGGVAAPRRKGKDNRYLIMTVQNSRDSAIKLTDINASSSAV
jgi:hypothetical protein